MSRQYKLTLVADFMWIKYEHPEMKQPELGNQLSKYSSTLQRCRNDINMLSPYRINPNNTNKRIKSGSNINFNNNPLTKHDLKRAEMTSNDIKPTSNNEAVRNKKKTN